LHGLYTEKQKVTLDRTFTDMGEDELRAWIQTKLATVVSD
jgi:hypothetical protein